MIGKGGKGVGLFRFSPPNSECLFVWEEGRAGPGGDLDANCLIGMEGGEAPDIFKEAFLLFGKRNCFLPVAEE